MSARILSGRFFKREGIVIEDFQALPVGDITGLPEVTGTAECVIEAGTFVPR